MTNAISNDATLPNKSWGIWMEGFSATGSSSGAKFLGTFEAATFIEACQKYVATLSESDQAMYYNPQSNAYWGCRFFDNEADARKSFG